MSSEERLLINKEAFETCISGMSMKGFEAFPQGNKVNNAFSSYGIPYGDTVFLLIDETLFKNAKDGLAITSSGIYWHNKLGLKSPENGLTWDRIKHLTFNICDKYIEIGSYVFPILISKCDPKNLVNLIEKLALTFEIQIQRRDKPETLRGAYKEQSEGNIESTDYTGEMLNSNMVISEHLIEKVRNKIKLEGIEFNPSNKHLEMAYLNYGLPRNEKIYAIIDGTLLGGAESGLAITPNGIYWKNKKNSSPITKMSWDDLEKNHRSWATSIGKISFGSDAVYDTLGTKVGSDKILSLLVNLIAEFRKEESGIEDDIDDDFDDDENENQIEDDENIDNDDDDDDEDDTDYIDESNIDEDSEDYKHTLEYYKDTLSDNSYFYALKRKFAESQSGVKKIKFINAAEKFVSSILAPTEIDRFIELNKNSNAESDYLKKFINVSIKILEEALSFDETYLDAFGDELEEMKKDISLRKDCLRKEYSLETEVATFSVIMFMCVIAKNSIEDRETKNFAMKVFANIFEKFYSHIEDEVDREKFDETIATRIKRYTHVPDTFIFDINDCASYQNTEDFFNDPYAQTIYPYKIDYKETDEEEFWHTYMAALSISTIAIFEDL